MHTVLVLGGYGFFGGRISEALARKLARGEALPVGAMPCMSLISVADYIAALDGLAVWEVAPEGG